MTHLTLEAKAAIITRALSRSDISLQQIAAESSIGYSTLQRWLQRKREGLPLLDGRRCLNENTNGLVRQYFPKKTSFDSITDDQLQAVAWKLNTRPRKCLGYRTPLEVFSEWLMDKGVALRI